MLVSQSYVEREVRVTSSEEKGKKQRQSKCYICERKAAYNVSFCEEHWYALTDTPRPFRGCKEMNMRDFITSYMIRTFGIEPVCNKTLGGTRLRPDIQFKTYHNRLVLIEIDEYMHKGYSQEARRTKQIKEAEPNAVLIRINVDSYTEHASTLIKRPSIWTKTSQADVVKSTVRVETHVNIEELKRRIKIIKNTLRDVMNPSFPTSVVKLFYN